MKPIKHPVTTKPQKYFDVLSGSHLSGLHSNHIYHKRGQVTFKHLKKIKRTFKDKVIKYDLKK